MGADALLRLWEAGAAERSDSLRALLCLAFVYPERTHEELSAMSVGRRDRCLWSLRERWLGKTVKLWGDCPACQQPVEIVFDPRSLSEPERDDFEMTSHRLEHGSFSVVFRLPDSTDLEAAGGCQDDDQARQLLLDRCVLDAKGSDGDSWQGSSLPSEIQDALESEIDRIDPFAVVKMDLDCPECAHRWQSRLDISTIAWTELAGLARDLLREISLLARHYHWSEQSILAMSARRRRSYLELAEG